ncbi:MAG: hypothetical protein CO158_08175 [Piscirickettsiaceae bacterium CG_4_9_14_3_um_filter_43_564]|nr:DUF4011 domain-containing protein [Thiomicrospira sp.]PIQ06503.1 MAG: hypothetical protein COW74_00220 [Piscirickettsiaceae bacterium CG18_big_fil_WC_8_21_14_2_50_44_103]PIU38784.1 MAG: hypothetical protein COT01_04595 [Piscirickettsiaceae bacterium CG07_land_8_20_14_0_80_44_28]PIW78491.1 MAG: hypothetical protein CO000_01605 [Piscirickettsiaceae bacterium CG_4_8_14_3_um_filter_44_38]PIX78028.1 MAG: hypothetical protein COZ36_11055 [Piscirickettsiaceae bacterium CG_4_10_14_3_um_filter_44_349
MESPLKLKIEHLSTFSLAAQQNAYPLFRNLTLHYPTFDNELSEDFEPLNHLVVKLTSEPELFTPEEWLIDEIRPGQVIALQQKDLNIPHNILFNLTEEMRVSVILTVNALSDSEAVLAKNKMSIAVLPANFWGGESRQPDLLAAFVKPNGVYVESLVKQVTEILEKNGHGRSADGYQSNTREKPYLMTAALWNVIFSQRIAYVTPPQDFARQGQRIRLAADISASKIGACLDTSLLFASCIELMGLNPVIALGKDHAFVGVWLIDERFPVLTTDDPMDLRKRIDTRDLVLFESTLVTNDTPVTFEQAKAYARDLISEDKEENFVYVIDIKQARARKIRPIFTVEEKPEEKSSDSESELNLPIIPPLPPVRADEQVVAETADTRIDTWQRKLLDLTKRNSLLALKDRAVAIKLYCPDIGSMEDRLADGVSFKFLSAEESPLNDNERSEESFRLQAGSDIHKEYALDQLNKNVLLANMSRKKLEQNAINLLRKTKNDLEEGGSNTLYLALGMLRWKENPEDDRSYRAPLILIPAELTRSSARAPIKVRQLPDESPIFNMTLIEFLNTEHSIDLNQFRESLPEDASGIDVNLIWSIVRSVIAEQPGFEVVEELVLASFSFAKYLMWKDLKDRIDDLKENLFVKHLVDHPQDAYVQDASFVLRDEVDEKIDPEKVFTPLNCDSSQLVAVEASGRPQDFVLEGPPGTGKSETIANIICHNMALGRNVLFVAEKMAALHVVYRRMEKVGLDHLCLELHSNKANKKAVLEQLREATARRDDAKSAGWVDSVRTLKDKRDHLNNFVQALHKKSIFGLSARDAIARDVLYKDKHSLSLTWSLGLESAPVNSAEMLDEMLESVKLAALAYNDISHLNPIQFRILKARSWSNAWQSQVVDCLTRYKSVLNELYPCAVILASNFNIDIKENTIANIARVNALAELITSAQSNPLSYLVAKGARDLLDSLDELSVIKREFDQTLNNVGHNISPEILANSPSAEWVNIYDGAKKSWFKRFFARIKINSSAKKLGYKKLKDMSVLSEIEKAANLQETIVALAAPFEEDEIWQGWDTTAESLSAAMVRGKAAHKALAEVIGLSDDLSIVLTAVKSKLIDGRDFLDSSMVVAQKNNFKQHWNAYIAVADEAKNLELEFDESSSLETVNPAIDELIASALKFKAWSEWLAAKESINAYQLDNLTQGLEARTILPDDAEDQALTAFCRWIAPQLIDESDDLRLFKASTHEQLIHEFRELDANVAHTTSQYVAAIAAQKVPDPFAKDGPKEFGVLARELQKKTRHKPVRSLFNEMGSRLMDLCPCMMMSPLSVAQFLPSDFNGFDLVIFDEASQMTTWDSVGAIARGKNVIVVGDPKQMPPTSFFSGAVDVGDPDEEDLESILDQALAARLPHLRLKGHYRSRHETLIAFSNSKYYENSLVTYPSSDTKESAVTLHRVDGVYSKGKGRNNPIEAAAVVKEIVKRLTDPERQHQSIGVVTLNTEQQRTVEDLLDDSRRQHPEIEPYFQSTDTYDGVFVKNLEAVQGDERDIIILSLSYGPTESGGRTMSMNFGPLNKSGGERRLNVAITRATSEVLLFSSFDSSMIDLSRSSALAVEHLKHYLEFAEKGPIALAEQSTAAYGVDQFDSDFEQAVAWALRNKGWNVQAQIGVSKFRVDLGIIHPDHPGVYLAGIECDGATYHGSPSARDRDRVRHGILENLGWRLIRLWSTDYFQDPEEALSKMHGRLNEILEEDRNKAELKKKSVDANADPSEIFSSDSVTDVALADSASIGVEVEKDSQNRLSSEYDHSRYFDDDYKPTLIEITKGILEEKNGITLHELALDIANLHGLSRTSKKQLQYLTALIEPWGGIKRDGVHKPVVWSCPEDIVDEMDWRGLDPWGDERDWSVIPYPEAKGLARLALEKSPKDPVDYICNVFKLKRRHDKTLEQFKSWMDEIRID